MFSSHSIYLSKQVSQLKRKKCYSPSFIAEIINYLKIQPIIHSMREKNCLQKITINYDLNYSEFHSNLGGHDHLNYTHLHHLYCLLIFNSYLHCLK